VLQWLNAKRLRKAQIGKPDLLYGLAEGTRQLIDVQGLARQAAAAIRPGCPLLAEVRVNVNAMLRNVDLFAL
jgi:hypothetical protein